MLRNAALRQWKVGTLDVTMAFLNADIVTPNKEVIAAQIPAVFRMIGFKEKYWKVRKALYGLDVSPRSWSLSRNKTLRQVDQLRPPPERPDEAEDTTQEAKATPVKNSPTVLESQVPSPPLISSSISKAVFLPSLRNWRKTPMSGRWYYKTLKER